MSGVGWKGLFVRLVGVGCGGIVGCVVEERFGGLSGQSVGLGVLGTWYGVEQGYGVGLWNAGERVMVVGIEGLVGWGGVS